MKKLALLFAGLSLMVATTSCNDDEETVQEFSIVGTWKPVAEVRTEVDLDGVGVSDQINYTTCQQQSTWVFADNSSGKRTDKDEAGNPLVCSTINQRNFSYSYNKSDKNFEIKYQGTVVTQKGKIVDLTAETMNLKIEDNVDPTVYKATTYTFKRVAQ
ncbi:lipocalin family protein [Chryseobacterium wangxinyae]|uniref:lipocalin family protein n=1 Tax=Chryseobacterium sp. CY353 TaxID=2997334 RepID=UPI002270BC5C|nr:lipocalin family protein [Chryseobacterium sp. CY353]MCY0970337.1 lipocalin family protein [Chryseobacterium sp. CY353]